MANGGEITFSTALDNAQLEKDLKDTEREISKLENSLSRANTKQNGIKTQLDEAQVAARQAGAEVGKLEARLAELEAMPVPTDPFSPQISEMNSVREQLDSAYVKLDEQQDAVSKLKEKWKTAGADVKNYTEQLDQAKARAAGLGQELSTSMKQSSGAMQQGMQSAAATMDMISKRITTMMKKVFFFSIILGILRSLKNYLSDAMMENESLRSSFEGLKASLAGLAQPLLGVLIPAVRSVINIFTAMVQTLGRIIDALFHTNIAASIQRAKEAANATRSQAKAQKELAKATKEANRQLMSFDELNQMQDNNQDSGGSGGAGDGGGGANWDAFDSGIIDEKLAEIMIILGAAIMAVGAILCFSGINIPLGITLMAMGALMMYTAASEQWGNLPAHVQQAITAVLAIVGAAVFAIGVILAFAVPSAQGIGLGMMAAGALLMFSAVAINWNSMSAELQLAISGLMAVLGVAALAIGAVLCFSGGSIPLGVALIAVGAASLVAAAALNWNNIPNAVEQYLDVIFAIVSVAFLAIGAVLCLSGVALPVGIALLALGAASLVAAATLAWNRMSDETARFVGAIMAIAGVAFLVLGIILIASGVGLPIGIALILAGAGALVTGAALNWNFIQDKIAEIWRGIVSWWNSTVARYFTMQFWSDKWKAMVNGLIACINRGLSAFGGFLNNISSGISGLLGAFGVSWHGSISMPQIPYLAQGAVIPPNRKFMAVLGDQTNGRNLEAPESLIRQIVREEAGGIDPQTLSSAVESGVLAALVLGDRGESNDKAEVIVTVDQYELARVVIKAVESLIHRGEYRPSLQVM